MTLPEVEARLVFVEGCLDRELSRLPDLAKEGILCTLSEDRITLALPAGASLQLVEQQNGHGSVSETRSHFDIVLGEGATLDYLKWQSLPGKTRHVASFSVRQAGNSTLRAGFFSAGGESEQQTVSIEQTGARAMTLLYGFCQPIRDRQNIDHAVDIVHAAPQGKSEMLYKGILDAASRASFRGRVKVVESGTGIETHQANHYLLLSEAAEASSRPELEIYHDDIACSHGATVGQMDESALFYLQSRGLSREVAGQILKGAFVAALFEKVPLALRPWLSAAMGYAHES